jgi:hypothetical protein
LELLGGIVKNATDKNRKDWWTGRHYESGIYGTFSVRAGLTGPAIPIMYGMELVGERGQEKFRYIPIPEYLMAGIMPFEW